MRHSKMRHRMRHRWDARFASPGILLAISLFAGPCVQRAIGASMPANSSLAERIVKDSGIDRGLCVVLGCADLPLVLGLSRSGTFLIHVLDTEQQKVEEAQQGILAQGLYGEKLSVQRASLQQLPYADGLVNLLVVAAGAWQRISPSEFARILHPNSVGWVVGGGEAACKASFSKVADVQLVEKGADLMVRKLRPAGMDDWTHSRHGADNNPVSNDQFAGPPFRTQWVSDPKRIGGHTNGRAVIANSRLFFSCPDPLPPLADPNSKAKREFKHGLYALDAFNGLRLWEQHHPAGSDNLGEIVATEEVLYYAGGGKGCQVLDARTGELKATFNPPGVDAADWSYLACADGLVFGATGGKSVMLFALEASSGNLRWKYTGSGPNVEPLCLGDGKLFFQNAENDMVALNAKTGELAWRERLPAAGRRKLLAQIIEIEHAWRNAGDLVFLAAVRQVGDTQAWGGRNGLPLQGCVF